MLRIFRVQHIANRQLSVSAILASTTCSAALMLGATPSLAQETSDSVDLPTVTVQSTQETAWGPVEGYIATRSGAGTKTDTPILQTPRSVSVVTRQEMDDRAAQNVVDAVSYTAGVVTGAYGYDPRFDDIYIRGFSVTSRGDYRDSLSQASGNFAYWRTEPYGLERIDIIKGPAGVLYGQTVPGGLINRISKMPVETPFAEVEAQLGDPNWLQAAFDIGGKAKEDGSILYRFTGVVRDADAPAAGTKNNEIYFAPALTFKDDSTRLTLLANILGTKLPASTYFYQPSGILTKVPVGTNYNAIIQTQEQVGYQLEHDFNDVWTARQNLRYGHIDNHSYWLYPTGVTSGSQVNVYAANYIEAFDTFQVDNQVQANFKTGPVEHKVLGGLDYLWADSNYGMGYGYNVSPINLLDPNADNFAVMPAITDLYGGSMNQLGLYLQDQISFGEGWHLNIGGRQDFVDSEQSDKTYLQNVTRTDQAFTWQAGLLYEFSNGIAPYVSYATSFLPSLNVDADGSLLEPSTGEQYEAGVKFQPKGGRSFFTLSAYQIKQDNYAVPDPTSYVYSPVGNIRVRGFEAEALLELAQGLDMTAAYTYTQGTILSSADTSTIGKTPVNMPENVASLWLKYTFLDGPMKGFGVGGGIRYYSGFWADNNNTYKNKSQYPVDAAIYYEKDAWKLQLNAKNMFNQEEALQNEGYWYWQQGRTVLASARYRW
ncbi:TonB-dependent siderophore receptor [Xanthobacter agilis]|uniref:TonB-dependent siderophore receptor n=1 Tax=Xanthobacter agilis TaxID=47492 RepID=UPI003726E818